MPRKKREARRPSGVLMHELALSFGVLAQMTTGRELSDWARGMNLEPRTKRKVLDDMSMRAVAGLDDPKHLVSKKLGGALHNYCRWVDATKAQAPEDAELCADWIVEHSLHLFGLFLGTARYAWGYAKPERPLIQAWFPRGDDEKAPSSTFIDETFVSIEKRAASADLGLTKYMDLARESGSEQKPTSMTRGTVARWRTGKTPLRGERAEQVGHAAGDVLFKLRLGVLSVLEKLASFQNGERSSPLGLVGNRNATLLWLVHSEWTSFRVQQLLHEKGFDRLRVIPSVLDPRVIENFLPRFHRPDVRRTADDLPYGLRRKQAVLIRVSRQPS